MSQIVKSNVEKLRKEAGVIGFKPMPGYLVVRLFREDKFRKGNIVIPEGKRSLSVLYKEMPLQGIVVAVGDDFVNDLGQTRRMVVKAGDHVALRLDGKLMDFKFRDVKYVICSMSDVYGVYEGVDVPNGVVFEDDK